MRVSIPWLKKFVNIKQTTEELADMLSMLGLEAEAPESASFSGIVVGKVITAEKHPNADRLKLCTVSDGQNEFQVVCGAPNVATNQRVPFAKIGAVLGDDFIIKKAKIRGERSFGMICSEKELGLSEEHEGIMILDDNAKIGTDFEEYLKSNLEYLEIDLTPNRPDCMSHVGVAREIAVKTGQKLDFKNAKNRNVKKNEVSELLSIKIEDKNDCPRYIAGLVKNISVGPSPKWLQDLLASSGQRSINNIVDISNYVLLEMGHPTHIFDFDKVPSNTIGIRKAKKGECVTTLDDEKRTLTNQLVITDGKNPIAIAGIMGGLDSAVTDKTSTVLIESAYFNPITIRRSAKSLGMSTEASKRFERGADPQGAEHAYWRVVGLLEELAGGEWIPGIIDEYPKKISQNTITLTREKINILSGCDLSDTFVKDTLSHLEIDIKKDGKYNWTCIPPSFRPDLEREVDLIEECCRVYGYDEISSSFHYGGLYDLAEVDSEDVLSSIAKTMSGLGFRQCYLNSLTDEKTSNLLGAHSVAMQNPLSSSMSHLRTSLFPGLLETLNYNIRNGASNVNLFEIGKEYRPGKMYDEVVHLTGVMHGEWLSKSVHNDDQHHSIYSLKGIINALFNRLNVKNISFSTLDDDLYEYGLSIKFGKTIIGHCGKMSQSFLKILNLDIDDVYGFDIELDSITSAMKIITNYESIVHYPKVDRDINFVLEDEIHSGDVVNAIMKACSEYLIAVQPVNIYQHESLGDNKKSVTFHLEFQSVVKTLEEAEINSAMNDITAIITKQFDAKLRD
jgi:phenylalanyl-tRNA synthetase beta chain